MRFADKRIMMKNTRLTLSAILAAGILLGLVSCGDDRPTTSDDSAYGMQAVLFYNSNDHSSLAYFKLTEDGNPMPDAEVSVAGDMVPHTGSGVYRAANPNVTLTPGASHLVKILTSDDAELLSQEFVVPDTFTMVITNPAEHVPYTGGFVSFEWNASSGTDGYFITVVRPDTALNAVPYAAFHTGLSNASQLGPEVFQESDGDDVPGTYDVYVVAYGETFYGWPEIFFPLPSQLPTGNIDEDNLTGTIGVGTMAIGDYVNSTKL